MKLIVALLLLGTSTPSVRAAPKGTDPISEKQQGWQSPAGYTIIHPKDGAEMVWMPGGLFRMGVDRETATQLGHKDYHEIVA